MARHRYDSEYGYGHAGYKMGPGWEWDDRGADPNWQGGGYGGMRMDLGPRQDRPAYGWHREQHQADLGGHGGFDGRYDLPDGWYDADGFYHERYEREAGWRGRGRGAMPPERYGRDYGPRHVENGGVRGDAGYLRQYNAHSPTLDPRMGGNPEGRGYGFAPGPDEPRMLGQGGRDERPREHRHQGYNTGGFSEGKYPGPGTRQSRPNR